MKLLVMDFEFYEVGYDLAVKMLKVVAEGRMSSRIQIKRTDILVSPIPERGERSVILFKERKEECLEEVAEAIDAIIVDVSFDELVSTLRRDGVISAEWPKPLWQ